MAKLVISARDAGFARWAQILECDQVSALLGETSVSLDRVHQMVDRLLIEVKPDPPKVLDRENVQISIELVELLQPFGGEASKSLCGLLEYALGKVLGAAIRSVALANACVAALANLGDLETLGKARLTVKHKTVLDSLNSSILSLQIQRGKNLFEILPENGSLYKKEVRRQCEALELSIASPKWESYAEWRSQHEASPVSRRLLWLCDQGAREYVLAYSNGGWNSLDGKVPMLPGSRIQLWHPLGRPAAEIEMAKDWLLASGVVQPFAQVFRECFELSGARPIAVESTLLKQADFATAAKTRGWKFSRLGAYSPDVVHAATKTVGLVQVAWFIERFEKSELGKKDEYELIRSSQLLAKIRNREVSWQQVLPRVVSEILRDVDGMLTEASVGTDTFWQARHPDLEWQAHLTSRDALRTTKTNDTRTDILHRFGPRNIQIVGSEVKLGSLRICLSTGEANQMVEDIRGNIRSPHEGDPILKMILHKTLSVNGVEEA